jgi:hypothetical protein
MSAPPTQLLDRTRRPGIHRVLSPPSEVAAALRGAGWAAVVVAPSTSGDDFGPRLAAALDVPGAGPAELERVLAALAEPTVLVLPQWTRLAVSAPEDWGRILEVLRQRSEVEPPFAVVLA